MQSWACILRGIESSGSICIAGDLGMDRAQQPQGKSGRNQETWKEMRMDILWRSRKNQHFYPS